MAKSKKSKATINSSDKVRRRNQDNKKIKFNPFDIHVNKQKHKILGKKDRTEKGKPGYSKERSIIKRKSTLLQEYREHNNKNVVIDRRLASEKPGEEVDFKYQRLAVEQAKFSTLSNDEEELTHLGRSLDEFTHLVSTDDEDDGDFLVKKKTDNDNPGSSLHKQGIPSHREIMQEVMARSKIAKHERQQQQEDQHDLTLKLDKEWKQVNQLIPLARNNELHKADDFDILVNSLHFEGERGVAMSRTKTKEELDIELRIEREKQEEARNERMHPSEIEVNNLKASADYLGPMYFPMEAVEVDNAADGEEDDLVYNDDDDESGEGGNSEVDEVADDDDESDGSDGNENSGALGTPDEDLQSIEAADSNNLDVIEVTDDEDNFSDVLGDSNSEDPEDGDQVKVAGKPVEVVDSDSGDKFQNGIAQFRNLRTDPSKKPMPDDLASLIEKMKKSEHWGKDSGIPVLKTSSNDGHVKKLESVLSSHDQFLGYVCRDADVVANVEKLIQRIEAKEHKTARLGVVASYVVSLFRSLAANRVYFTLDKMPPLMYAIASKAKASLSNAMSDWLSDAVDASDDITLETFSLLSVIPLLFSSSDFQHPVCSPALLLVARLINCSPVKSRCDVARRLFLCRLALIYVARSRRYVPEVISFLRGFISLCVESTPKADICLPFRRVNSDREPLFDGLGNAEVISVEDVFNDDACPISGQSLLFMALKILRASVSVYDELPAASDVYFPFNGPLAELQASSNTNGSEVLRLAVQDAIDAIRKLKSERVPLRIVTKRPPMSRLYEPFLEVDRKRVDKLNLKKKLTVAHRKELKGAIRELKRDSDFLAREKLKDQLERDSTRKRKVRELMGCLAGQEGEHKALKRKFK